MDINAIVESLYIDKRVNELVGKLEPADLRHDLLHHCILYLYITIEKYPGKIEKLHQQGQLFAWFSKCLKMELTSTRSNFFRRFRRTFKPLPRSVFSIPDTTENFSDWQEEADKRYGAGFWSRQVEMIENKARQEKSQPCASQMALWEV